MMIITLYFVSYKANFNFHLKVCEIKYLFFINIIRQLTQQKHIFLKMVTLTFRYYRTVRLKCEVHTVLVKGGQIYVNIPLVDKTDT